MPNKIWRFNSTQVLKKSRRTATDKGNKLEENFRVFELRGGSVVEAAKDGGEGQRKLLTVWISMNMDIRETELYGTES
ncbi:hypothetical protein GBA52_026602 [Prunus armeniaca]|nr:hypothetical protein GBA52_026602 [Prunus armeniaca]